MKNKIITSVLVLCLLAALLLPSAQADGPVYFTAIDEQVLPLSDETMPYFFNSRIYLPYTAFTDNGIGIQALRSDTRLLLYRSVTKSLTFNTEDNTVFDQDGKQYFISARIVNGTIYVPAETVTSFFGLGLSYIDASPAPVVRLTTASATFNDRTFVSIRRDQMQLYYDTYMGVVGPSPSPSSPSEKPTYEAVRIQVGFFDLDAGRIEALLEILDASRYKFCFFADVAEITENPDLIRRIAGSGHSLGIHLMEGGYDEYATASALLFEAAKIKTLLVTASEDVSEAAKQMAQDNDLIYWLPTINYGTNAAMTSTGVSAKLSTTAGVREKVLLPCADNTADILQPFLVYMFENQYTLVRTTEVTAGAY